MEKRQRVDVVRLPSEMNYFGHIPEFNVLNMLVRCKFCNQSLIPQALKGHIDRCTHNPSKAMMQIYKGQGSSHETEGEQNDSSSIGPDGKPVSKAANYRYNYKRPADDIETDDFDCSTDVKNVAICKLCGFKTVSSKLSEHLEKSHGLSANLHISGNSFPAVNSCAQSEVDTSSSNSSPVWESDKSNVYDSCLSSSSSNSVNIVRLKQEKPKYKEKNVIPLPLLLSGTNKKLKSVQETSHVKHVSSTSLPQPVAPLIKQIPSTHPSTVLPMDATSSKSNVSNAVFECRPYFETVQPSTSVQESSSDVGKSKLSIIIRRVPNQNANAVRRVPIEKAENSSRTDNLRCFLVEDDNRPQNTKSPKHQIKKKTYDNREAKLLQMEKQSDNLKASEQQISFLTGRIETLNKQIETLTGQVGPLRLENEKYKTEIRNLRCKVDELETSTNALIEQRNIRSKNDKKMEELKQSWERERFRFTQHLEELQTELNEYKTSSTVEKQKLTFLNTILEKKINIQKALSENIEKEREILQHHIPTSLQYQLAVTELSEIQRTRTLLQSVLANGLDCHLSNPSTIAFPNVAVEQLPLNTRNIVDCTYLPLDSLSTEIPPGSNGQFVNVFNLRDNKIQYQSFTDKVTNTKEILDLKEGTSNKGNEIS